MVAMYTVDMMVICVLINIVTELLARAFRNVSQRQVLRKGRKGKQAGLMGRTDLLDGGREGHLHR